MIVLLIVYKILLTIIKKDWQMKINKVHHIAIICSDYKKSKTFYVNILGFKILQEVYRKDKKSYKLDLAIGANYQIELFSFENPPKRITNPEAAGLRHLALEVDNVENCIKELNNKGVEIEPIRIDEYTDKKFAFFKDPDGLPIENYEK